MGVTIIQPTPPFRPGGVIAIRMFDGTIPPDMTVNHGPGRP